MLQLKVKRLVAGTEMSISERQTTGKVICTGAQAS